MAAIDFFVTVIIIFLDVMTKYLSDILRIICVASIVKGISRIVREVKKKQAGGPLKLKKAEGNTQRKGKGSQETIVVSFQFNLIRITPIIVYTIHIVSFVYISMSCNSNLIGYFSGPAKKTIMLRVHRTLFWSS